MAPDLIDAAADLAHCIELLWSEIPLNAENHVIDRLHREGCYDVWEWALDYKLAGGGGDDGRSD